jgi:glycosyltransferase involved in cell wall biosynthesis
MRVLMVNDLALESGWGAEIHIARLAEGLRRAGDTVELFAGEIVHRGASRTLDVWDPFARRALQRRAAGFRPDVVHHHNVLRELSISVLGVPTGVPTVMTVHEHRLLGVLDDRLHGPRDLGKVALSRLHRRAARRHVDVLVGVSRDLTSDLQAAGFPNVVYMPSFADVPPPELTPLDVRLTKDVVLAGRLTPDKGVRVATQAFARVAGRHPRARLLVAGEGPEATAVLALQGELGSDRVQLLGKLDVPGVQSLLAQARVVVAPAVPSVRPEGAGLTPIEAALLGRPTIVSDDPALREFVDESDGGLVVPAGSVTDLAVALDRLLSDAELAHRLGAAGRRVALERRTTTAVLPLVRAAYERALELRAVRPS